MKRLLYILLYVIVSLPIYADARLDSLFLKAVYNREYNLMSQYADQGVDINVHPRGRYSLLHYFAAMNVEDGVDWCIMHQWDVNIKDSLGATPLMYAAFNGYSSICRLLINNGADTQLRSLYGITAAEYAKYSHYDALAAYIDKPSLPVPHDFYLFRKKIAKALRYADYKKAKKEANQALKYAKKELAPQNNYNVYLLVDLAKIAGQEEDFEAQSKYLDAACKYAQKYMPYTEEYYYAKIAHCIANLSPENPELLDSLMEYYGYSTRFISEEARWWAIIGVVLSEGQKGNIREAEATLYMALYEALSMAWDDDEFYSDYVIHTFSLILDYTVRIGDAKAMEEAMTAADDLRSFIVDRHDYVAAMARARLGHYYRFLGQGGHAKIWYQRANEDLEKTVGKSHRSYIENTINIGTEEMQRGQIDSALVYFYNAKAALERNSNMDSYTGGMVEQSIAACKYNQYILNPTEYTFPHDAEKLFLNAWNKIQKYGPGPEGDVNLGILAENMAFFYTHMKLYGKAKSYAYKAMSIIKQINDVNNQIYLNAVLVAISLESELENHEKVDFLITDYISIAAKLVRDQFCLLTEANREDIWNSKYDVSFRQHLPSIITASIEDRPSLSKALYNCALFSKGILLHTSNEIQNRLREMHNPEIDQLLDAITNSRKRLTEIEQAYPGEYPEEWRQLIVEVDDMEKIVLNLGRKFQDNLFLDNVSWSDIKEHLLPKQTAIEILRFDADGLVDKSDSTYYVATIVSKDSNIPQYVYLFEESKLSPLVNSSNKDNIYDYNRNGRQLSEMIWSKLLPYIGEAKTIYFSPDGMLCQLAIEALPLSVDSVYGDVYDIVRCSSTKYILQPHKEDKPTSVDLFGGIQYDMTPKEMTNQSHALAVRDAYRGEMPDSLTRGHYEELIGAKQEVSNIAQLLNNSHIEGRLYTGSDASEEAFKALSGAHPNVLHIATHGFFWPQEEAERKDYFMASFIANNTSSHYVSSMERAGLLFAGANLAMTGHRDELPSNVEDGVLSAQEISTMDLYGTDLVVLSACETGQGDLEGDGVYGLQRAFKLAGVQTIIMSLWKVNDAATQMLMTEFYSNWIVNNMNKRKAFETAKQKVRANYPEPSCWAGFIMLD